MSAARWNSAIAVVEVAGPDRQPALARRATGHGRARARGRARRRRRRRRVAGGDEQVAEQGVDERDVLGRQARRRGSLLHRGQRDVELAVQLGEVRDAGERRQVGADREHLGGCRVGVVVAPELDEGIDDDRPRRGEVRRHGDRLAAGLERLGELVLAELEATDPGQDLGVVGGEPAGGLERLVGRRVERRIGRLADPLEEGEPEVALGVRVGRVGGDERLEPGDLGDGRRGRRRRASSADAVGRRTSTRWVVVGSATAMAGSRTRSRRSAGPTQGAWSTGASRRSWPWYGPAAAADDRGR